MTRRVVVDSSVIVKWFPAIAEERSDEAFELLSKHRAERVVLAAPSLARLEVMNAFWKRRATAEDMAELADVLGGFGIEWHSISDALARDAARLAAEYALTVYDSAFVALALRLDAELVTRDKAIVRAGACRTRALDA